MSRFRWPAVRASVAPAPRARATATLAALAALATLIAGCHAPGSAAPAPATPSPPPVAFCTDLGGVWHTPARRCTLTGDDGHAHLTVSYPVDLIDDPTAGPVIQMFVREFVHQHATSPTGGESDASLTSAVFRHGDAITSVLFDADWYAQGTAHPGQEFTAFTFDLAQGSQLQLADLFCPGVDPLQVIPPLVRPQIQQQLGDGPPNVADFEPGTGYTYADDYRAWLLDGDDLVLYLPAGRTGPVHGGMVKPRLALADLAPQLREGGCRA